MQISKHQSSSPTLVINSCGRLPGEHWNEVSRLSNFTKRKNSSLATWLWLGWSNNQQVRHFVVVELFRPAAADSWSVLAVVEHHRHHRVESRSLNECFSFYLLHSIPSREEFHANQYSISYTVSRYFTRWDWIPGP